MKILMLASELYPFIKIGGLGDVLYALPRALSERGHRVDIVCPLYGELEPQKDWKAHIAPLSVHMGRGDNQYARVWETTLPETQVKVHFIEHHGHFGHIGVYSDVGNDPYLTGLRFAFLSRAAIDLCAQIAYQPDIIHVHDWHSSLLPVYLKTKDRFTSLAQAKTVLTIHNLQHQGLFDKRLLEDAGLGEDLFRPDALEALGAVNVFKGGLYYADKITAVSKGYASEIQNPEYGCGLDPILRERAQDLVGIRNGIDTKLWNPQTDPYLPQTYGSKDLAAKQPSKRALQEAFGLEEDLSAPIFGAVARLYDQKGLDLWADIIPKFMESHSLQVVVLGSGERDLEERFQRLQSQFPGRVGVHIGYKVEWEHLVQAGSDFFVMPSRFEPCGLTQMYAMRYGTIPVVRATGGLKDTVLPYTGTSAKKATGFHFEAIHPDALQEAIQSAYTLYTQQPAHYRKLQQNAMQTDFSWDGPAAQYEALYTELLQA